MARIKPQALLNQSKRKKGPARISATTIFLCNLVVVVIVLSLVATYKHWSQRSRNQPVSGLSTFKDTANSLTESKKYDLPGYAILNTSKGYITVELYKDGSPMIVDNFLDLCQKEYFKGLPFHHVIKHYVIQAGHGQGLGAAEDWTTKGKLHSRLATSPKHEAFMIGTSKTKDSTGFELFITTAPIPDLNDKLLVFGRTVKGEDVVQEIEEVDTDEHYRPKSPVVINGVTLKHEI
ncbi:PEPTIDYL-PROLYL CIS-TRANS ISOMERASE CYP21-4 [Salix viminalis]|uniref:Peptidyl-prolyl cis-trans isomerase n=3 Tax=Salix TaxID=40685 RepID=A0A9Q0Z265_SALPP|nr:hypothetical protein DKX38_015903 [Salix brachista]KAJ6718544.1 PEPTIDYL-PROLYL CIS-TRANS ISOMERASE CYP21-4 [Salix purpurea]KAJ6718545.1 PEPTIDYL-PROLYL CIS-TRANS ISOMERASE CYP21-4 [Salix purpurea]KAJ6720955.1 PEPTIDYL-PROLYL CIS-TRANS ISOMERASE CYP21-4 [Salix viminalis]KAJ6720956.1 PEPTIDYL-PROLYL CIS-TRANS ISOMERASE CYP21-4 [Salix viminalis]